MNALRKIGLRSLWLACLVAGALGLAIGSNAQTDRTAIALTLDGAVGPAIGDYLVRGMDTAAERGAELVIIRMDTPGGLDTSMRQIIRAILDSPVPVATYVTPSGARAASAGTYIMYASHVAAMAPATSLGAATPVQIGGGGLPFGREEEEEDEAREERRDENGEEAREERRRDAPQPRTAMERKVINDAVAYIRGLAELRDRNADWAERAVREAATLGSTEAREQNVVDIVARNIDELLDQADGMTVTVREQERTLSTAGLTVEALDPDLRTRILATITNPNVALILMMVGIYGLIFEFMNPGALYPGTVGAICLLLGLYALAALPLNYAALGLIVLGIGLMVAEAFAPSFGILGIGGVIAFILGAAMLLDPGVPGFEIAWEVIGGVAAVTLAFTLIVMRMAIGAHGRQVAAGREHMIGTRAKVLTDWSGTSGHVLAVGERWQAVSAVPLEPGQTVRVAGIDGLTLSVEPETERES